MGGWSAEFGVYVCVCGQPCPLTRQGNRARVGKWVRQARELNQLFVLIIVDPVLEEQRLIKFEADGIHDIPCVRACVWLVGWLVGWLGG